LERPFTVRDRRKSGGEIPGNPTRNIEPNTDENEREMFRGNSEQPWRGIWYLEKGDLLVKGYRSEEYILKTAYGRRLLRFLLKYKKFISPL